MGASFCLCSYAGILSALEVGKYVVGLNDGNTVAGASPVVWGQALLTLGGEQLVAFAKSPTPVFYPLYEQVCLSAPMNCFQHAQLYITLVEDKLAVMIHALLNPSAMYNTASCQKQGARPVLKLMAVLPRPASLMRLALPLPCPCPAPPCPAPAPPCPALPCPALLCPAQPGLAPLSATFHTYEVAG